MRVLIIDDNAANVDLVKQVLERAGYTDILTSGDPEGAAHLVVASRPDVILLDLHMPKVSGYEVMSEIRQLMQEPENLPVLVLTADATPEARHRALSMGARDFISKPIDHSELLLRTHNVLQTRSLQLELQDQNASLDRTVRERTLEVETSRLESLTILAAVGEYHDDETHEHTQRVGRSAASIAQALALPAGFVSDLRDAAPLHDIGKLGVSREILRKPGPLTDEERKTMMRHAEIGAQILASAQSPALQLAAEIARTHHEHWDGAGYPAGMAGEEIPLAGRITAVADVFDALTHRRPYKPAWELKRALALLNEEAGRHFDPRVVEAFRSLDARTLVADGDEGPLAQAA
jgi:putative two-component system response regulator